MTIAFEARILELGSRYYGHGVYVSNILSRLSSEFFGSRESYTSTAAIANANRRDKQCLTALKGCRG